MQNRRSFSQLAAHVPLDRLYARIGDIPEQARCLFWRAKIAFDTNAIARGREDLSEAEQIFAALGAWPEHSRTQALIEDPLERSIVL
jgi:hypothetical protein